MSSKPSIMDFLLRIERVRRPPPQPPVFTPISQRGCFAESRSNEDQPNFPQFARLPGELQLAIWEHAASETQVLRLARDGTYSHESASFDHNAAILRARSPPLSGTKGPDQGTMGSRHNVRPLAGDLVVLSRQFTWVDVKRLGERDTIRHLAIHYDLIAMLRRDGSNHEPTEQLVQKFRQLRTWELWADWLESLDRQRAVYPGRCALALENMMWIPPYRTSRFGQCECLLQELNPESGAYVPEKRLVGRPMFQNPAVDETERNSVVEWVI